MSIWAAVLLGLVQGIAEFLPISSSGHLSVLQNLFSLQTGEGGHLLFDVMLHLGTIVAILAAYWKDIVQIVQECVAFAGNVRHRTPGGERRYPAGRLVLMIVLGTLPLFLILPVNDYIETLYYNTFFIGAVFLITGCVLYVSNKLPKGRKKETGMRMTDALIVGICQAVATLPGLSRSGTTITAGMATGLDREFAVKYSLLMSVPAVLGANLLTLIKSFREGVDFTLLPVYLIGMLTAMVSGYVAIHLLRRLTKNGKFGKFAYYCWGAGVVTIILSLIF
jgi:undecaprenyl-diphosphatase